MVRLLALALALVAGPAAAQFADATRTAPAARADLGDFYLEDAADAAFDLPVAAAFAPGGLMFVVEKRGIVWTVRDGVRDPVPFIDLRDEVLDQHDRGMLGIAVDPRFAHNHRLYLSYTVDPDPSDPDAPRFDAFARVTRYAGHHANPGLADPATRRVLIGKTFEDGIPSCYNSHTIGTLAFGADRTLFVGTGDGASYHQADAGGLYDECFGTGRLDPSEDIGAFRAQRLESLAGKILRINPRNGRGLRTNPFWTGDGTDTASKVWALGLRNPFRFTVDVSTGLRRRRLGQPGTLYIGDVGWNVWEEINTATGGENFGWPCFEGPAPLADYQAATPATNGCDTPLAGTLTDPTSRWHHSDASQSDPAGRRAAAVVGGAIYPGTAYPEFYQGALFHGDYARGWAAVARPTEDGALVDERLLAADLGAVVHYAYDPESDFLHLVDIGAGRVWRLRHGDGPGGPGGAPPVASAWASPSSGGLGTSGLRVQFSPEGSAPVRGGALSYAWDFGDGATSTDRAPVHTYTEAGTFTARLTVTEGAESATATRTVTAQQGSAPTIRIVSPTASLRGAPGRAVPLRAVVADADQPAGDLFVRWTVVQMHDSHLHPDVFEAADAEATFVVPAHGAPSDHVYYRVTAEVRDATGLTTTAETALLLDGWSEAEVAGTPTTSMDDRTNARGAELPGVLVDGVTPGPDGGVSRQRATYSGTPERAVDWVEIATGATQEFTRVSFQEGVTFGDGGWFEAPPRVEVRRDGQWQGVTALTVSPAYRADDGRPFDTYELAFAPAEGDAVRVVGPPAGSNGFITAAEVRAYAVGYGTAPVAAPWSSGDVGTPSGAGSAGTVGRSLAVVAGGALGGSADAAHLVTQPLAGDGSVTVRVDALGASDADAKAGLTIRGSLADDAPHATVALTPAGVELVARTEAGGSTTSVDDAPGAGPVWLRLTRTGSTVSASSSTDGETWTAVGQVGVPALTGSAVAGLVVATGGTTAEGRFTHAVVADAVPAPWASADLGTPIAPGRARVEAGTVVITAGGDIWNAADHAHFVSQPLAADGAVVARVEAPAGPWVWGKAGLTVRASGEAGAAHLGLWLSHLGLHVQKRPSDNVGSEVVADQWGRSGPQWLRLERSGTTVTAFRSDDGATWEAVASSEVPGLGTGPVLIGLAASSSDDGDGARADARFTDAAVTTATSGRALVAEAFGLGVAYPNPATARATVRVTLAPGHDATLDLLDVLGRRVATVRPEASGPVALDLGGVPAGTYLVRLVDGPDRATQRLTVVR